MAGEGFTGGVTGGGFVAGNLVRPRQILDQHIVQRFLPRYSQRSCVGPLIDVPGIANIAVDADELLRVPASLLQPHRVAFPAAYQSFVVDIVATPEIDKRRALKKAERALQRLPALFAILRPALIEARGFEHLVDGGRKDSRRHLFGSIHRSLGGPVQQGVDFDGLGGAVLFEAEALGLQDRELSLRLEDVLLGRPPLREDTKPYLGRSSWYPEGVRENGMYCHGVQWLVGAARLLAERFEGGRIELHGPSLGLNWRSEK